MKRGEIVLVDLPASAGSAGREQIGTRPALIVHSDASNEQLPVVMVIPFTSQLGAQRYPHTILIQPDEQNGLSVPSVLMVFQLRALDKTRIVRSIGMLKSSLLVTVENELRQLLDL